ncbi:MAG: hypothetical protein V1726_01395 [Methanobacteriota archaeon]
MSEFGEKEILQKLYVIVVHNPGLHLNRIAELLQVNVSEAERLLSVLDRQGVLLISREKGFCQYYINERGVSAREKRTLEMRRRIYDLLVQNPGLHLSRIAELLKMSIPLTDYHLLSMERHGDLSSVKDEKRYHKRYYVKQGELGVVEARVLEVLQKKVALQIVLILLRRPVLQHKDILKQVTVSSSTLSYYLDLLVSQGVLTVQFQGAEKGYMVVDREKIISILRKYEYHIEVSLALEGFKSLWDDFRYQR